MSRIRIPPGGTVTLEISEEGARIVPETGGVDVHRGGFIQDPIGGPPLYVSSHLRPDAMALYMLSTAIIDCTRALASHEAVVEKAQETQLRVEAAYKRAALWSKAVVAICGFLTLAGGGNVVLAMWARWHGW